MKKFFAVFLLFAMSSLAQAQGSFSVGRFEEAIRQLDSALTRTASQRGFGQAHPVAQVEALIRGGVRMAAFNLQSLGRLYKDYPLPANKEFIKTVRGKSKDLEDALGAFDKYKTIGQRRKAEEAAVKAMNLIAQEAWLDRRGQSPMSQAMGVQLVRLAWMPAEQDRQFLLGQMILMLEELRTERLDMNYLEAGLHELRRRLRWWTISAQVLGGLVYASTTSACPLRRATFISHGDPKYFLSTTTTLSQACPVSDCLAKEMVGAVGLFGKLKDQAEPLFEADARLHEGDLTPPSIARSAQAAYGTLLSSQILERTQDQLRSCLR